MEETVAKQVAKAYPAETQGTNWGLILVVFALVGFWVGIYQAYQHWDTVWQFLAPQLF